VIFKVYCKILVLLGLVQIKEILDVAMAKIKKIDIAVTYSHVTKCLGFIYSIIITS
jgi:hypothetical protein